MIWDGSLYRMRAKCLENRGETRKAIADLRTLTKLVADSTEVFFEVSKLYYNIGDVEESLRLVVFFFFILSFLFSQIRECLKLNPDHKDCFPFYKRVKKLVKMRENLVEAAKNSDWMGCLEKGQQILKFEKSVNSIQLDVYRETCKCNREVRSRFEGD